MPRLDRIVGARVRRIDLPAGDLLAITLAQPGGRREVLLLCCGSPPRIGLVDERPRGAPAQGLARVLRREVGNGVVRAIRIDEQGSVHIEIERAGASWMVGAARGEREPTLHRTAEQPRGNGAEPPLEELRVTGPRILAERSEVAHRTRATELRRALSRHRRRLERKRLAIEGDLGRAAQAPALRRDASLLLAHLHLASPGTHELKVTDWEADPPGERTLQIDRKLGPKAQADAWFHRAKRLERGTGIARERLERTRQEIEAVDVLLRELDTATEADDALQEIEARAAAAGVRPSQSSAATGSSRETAAPGRQPFHTFIASGGRPVLVGRGAADNDALTLHHAKPHDLWLHARGQPGAHVVVPLARGEACPPELLVDAATLAAHFSEARGEPVVEVQHTARRFVRKPRKSPPGRVLVEREKVIAVRIEPARLARLLGRN